jgi:DNA-binding MarR family transcriptional regulator
VSEQYLEVISLIERLHRQFLEVVKLELDSLRIHDLNNVQAMMLYTLGDADISIGELMLRGYYLGSNVSYNVKKLVEMGYLHHARSRVDRRSVRISLTEKGQQVHEVVRSLYDKHARTIEPIGGITGDDFQRLNHALVRLERFWTDQIRYRL